jgi:hypothetical protein
MRWLLVHTTRQVLLLLLLLLLSLGVVAAEAVRVLLKSGSS